MTNTTYTNTQISALEFFELNKLQANDLDIEITYHINEFLVNQSLNMIFASAGQGKSFLVLSIALKLLKEGKIVKCLYLDMDNSTMALKCRSLDDLLNNYKNLTYLHHSKVDVNISEMLFKLGREVDVENKSLLNYLIIIDSIRDFLGGRDMNADREIMPVMDNLKKLREAGATIIFLHHTKKDSEGTVYKGSTSFLDSVDVAFSLKSEKVDAQTLIYSLGVYKDRIPVNNSSFTLNTETMQLVQKNYQLTQLSQSEQEFIANVEEALAENSEGINQTKLLEAVGTDKNNKTARKYLQKFAGQFWTSKQEPNTITYYPLLDEVA